MLPATNIKPTDMAKKLKAIKELRMTTHQTYPVYLFPEKPRTYGSISANFRPSCVRFGNSFTIFIPMNIN